MSSRRLFSVVRVSTLVNHSINFAPLTKLFPPPVLQLHRYSCTSSALLQHITQETIVNVNSHHPWPKWVSFIDHLNTKGYIPQTPIFYRDMNLLKDPCLSFARHRFHIFKSLSRQDIQTLVEKACPNLFPKAVNSAKRLRAYLQLDEGEVCSGCNLRASCDKAYVILKEPAGTIDIVRILLFYALDPLVISGGEKSSTRGLIEVSTRKLLLELIELSNMSPSPDLPKPTAKATHQTKQSLDFVDYEPSRDIEMKRGDWMCSKCSFMNFSRNIQCRKCGEDGPKRVGGDDIEMKKGDWICSDCSFINFSRNVWCLKCKAEGRKRVGADDIEMKKGDWNCSQCGFMNFASNTKCLRCREQRPKRQLNPGEWECSSCDFLNYRSNMACKKCNCERPKESKSKV